MAVGQLVKYGYHEKKSKKHPDFGTLNLSAWITGLGVILSERKTKQSKLEKILYETLQKRDTKLPTLSDQTVTFYTVLLTDGSKRELGPLNILDFL